MKPICSLIAQHPFLAELDPAHLAILSDYAMERTFEDGECIFSQGDTANRFYLINSGRVCITSRDTNETTVEIESLGEGDVLGWSWLFEPRQWQFDAHAVGVTKTIFFYGTPLLVQLEENPAMGYELMKRMANVTIRRLQSTREKLLSRSPS